MGAVVLASVGLAACRDAQQIVDDVDRPGSDKGQGSGGPGGAAVGGGSGGATAAGGAGGAAACVDVTFDHDVLCVNIVDAKDQAWADCQQRGLVMTAFGPATDCHVSDPEGRRLTYTCCPTFPPPPPPPPPPTRDPSTCQSRIQGTPKSCESASTEETAAIADCAADGFEAADVSYEEACGDGSYRFVVYSCCTTDGSPFPVPPPEPPTPFDGPPVSGPSRYARYKCCTSPSSCSVENLGSPSDCKDAATWNSEAATACSAAGGTVYGVPLYESCSL